MIARQMYSENSSAAVCRVMVSMLLSCGGSHVFNAGRRSYRVRACASMQGYRTICHEQVLYWIALSASISTSFACSSAETEPRGAGPILLILRPWTMVEPRRPPSTSPPGLKVPFSPKALFSDISSEDIFNEDYSDFSLGVVRLVHLHLTPRITRTKQVRYVSRLWRR